MKLNTVGLKYRRYTSKRPLKRRVFAWPSSFKALQTLSESKHEAGEKIVREARTDTHGEAFSDRQEEVLKVVKKALRVRKNAEKVKIDYCSEMETTLREANEKLVVASVNAHMMTEAVERVSVHLSYMAEHDPLTGLPNREIGRAHV